MAPRVEGRGGQGWAGAEIFIAKKKKRTEIACPREFDVTKKKQLEATIHEWDLTIECFWQLSSQPAGRAQGGGADPGVFLEGGKRKGWLQSKKVKCTKTLRHKKPE